MPLALTVALISFSVLVIVGVTAYLIDQDLERHEERRRK